MGSSGSLGSLYLQPLGHAVFVRSTTLSLWSCLAMMWWHCLRKTTSVPSLSVALMALQIGPRISMRCLEEVGHFQSKWRFVLCEFNPSRGDWWRWRSGWSSNFQFWLHVLMEAWESLEFCKAPFKLMCAWPSAMYWRGYTHVYTSILTLTLSHSGRQKWACQNAACFMRMKAIEFLKWKWFK